MKKIASFLLFFLPLHADAVIAPTESVSLQEPAVSPVVVRQPISKPIQKKIKKKLPSLEVTTLCEKKLCFPAQCKNRITIALFGFDRSASDRILSWSVPLHKKYKSHAQIQIRQFAMVGPANAFTKWVIDTGMKSSIEKPFHHTVFVYYGELDEWKNFLEAKAMDECYVLLLDHEGHVHAEFRGKATEESLKQLDALTSELVVSTAVMEK